MHYGWPPDNWRHNSCNECGNGIPFSFFTLYTCLESRVLSLSLSLSHRTDAIHLFPSST